jgi:hypothetical protein
MAMAKISNFSIILLFADKSILNNRAVFWEFIRIDSLNYSLKDCKNDGHDRMIVFNGRVIEI